MKNIFKTVNDNHYLYRSQENKAVYLHPLINFFFEMEERGMSAGEWCDNLEGPGVNVKDIGVFTTKQIRYYFKKYNLLKEKNYFSTVKDDGLYRRRLTGHDIDNLLTACKSVIFEVTRSCNMNCRYCFQGDLYRVYDPGQKVNIDVEKAKLLLNYLAGYWSRPLSPKRIGIKFFGGEPLMDFAAVKEIVEYTKTLTGFSERFYYYITTNGVLLDRYLDYLVAGNFYIAVSLDGDKDNNSHRVHGNGKPSFDKITANLNRIRDNHPTYFEKNISFQTVIHNNNSLTDVHGYFEKTYKKQPLVAGLTEVGVNRDRKSDFDEFRTDLYHSLYHGDDYPLLMEKKLADLPKTPDRKIITHNIYNWLLKDFGESRKRTPTGTCHPFSKGIFLSTEGKLLPCERIDQTFALGYINDEVVLDLKAIADRFNGYFDNMSRLCLSCANAKFCKKCMFFCKVEEARPVCNKYCDQKEFLRKLSDGIGYMEDKPEIYYKHITEI